MAFFGGNNYRPSLAGIAGAAADVDDEAGEGAAGEAGLARGFDDVAGLDRRAGLGEGGKKPVRAEPGVRGRPDLGRLG